VFRCSQQSESAKSSSEDDLLRDVEAQSNTVFESKPYREFKGHESYVVDLAWSKTLLLLSASLDKTVRLWHVSRPECLHRFQHPQEVTSVVCHPTDYRYFLTGCLDKKLRIWSLNTGRVVREVPFLAPVFVCGCRFQAWYPCLAFLWQALWQPTAEMITSVAFTPDARIVIAGLYNGVCTFYLTDGLRYLTQVECRNRKGSMKRGRKVTGLEFINSGSHLLVTTNDSRLRLISMEDFSMTYKYKGLVNKTCQIRASFEYDSVDDLGWVFVCRSGFMRFLNVFAARRVSLLWRVRRTAKCTCGVPTTNTLRRSCCPLISTKTTRTRHSLVCTSCCVFVRHSKLCGKNCVCV
jgi:WD repeat-containing protein 44